MSRVSYSDVFGIEHRRPHEEDIQVGDLVRTGPNYHPHYRVIAVHDQKAWVRNVETGLDGITGMEQCRRINGAPNQS